MTPQAERPFDIIGIGNAVMDVISRIEDADLARLGVEKGVMQLIDAERAEVLLAETGADSRMVPGGSVANTLDGLSRLGHRAAFLGRVADDAIGQRYAADTQAAGTAFPNPPVKDAGLPSSRSIILVTPDGERSMNTYLGTSGDLTGDEVAPDLFTGGPWLFLEGYLFDKEAGKQAFLKAADLCQKAGGQAGIALSDPFCVDRHREDFRRLVAGPMDYVIGNEHEWMALYQTSDLETALAKARADCGLVICTRSGEDAILIREDERVTAPVHKVVPVDATGAGDQFAAGLLHGLIKGLPLDVAGRMGCIAAAEVISHYGARPEADISALFREAGLG